MLEWVFDWVGAGGSLGGCSGGLSCDWVGACEDILCIDCVGGWVLEVLSCDWVGVGGSFVSGRGSFVSGRGKRKHLLVALRLPSHQEFFSRI